MINREFWERAEYDFKGSVMENRIRWRMILLKLNFGIPTAYKYVFL